jgi:replicative DNA helicase
LNLTQPLPASLDCERAILGGVFLDNAAYFQAAMLSPESFSLDSHRRIFLRMGELAESGTPIDFNTLTEQLGKHREIEAVGGVSYVTSLTDGLPKVKNIAHHVKIVQDKAMLRNLIHSCNRNVAAAYDQQESAQSMIGRALDDILSLQSSGVDDPMHVSEFSNAVTESLMAAWQNPESIERYTLGVTGLTEKTGGMLQEEYGVIMGRTGDGKTGLALQIALENALRDKPVLFFTLELSKEVMLKRAYCQISRVSNRVVIKHTVQPLPSEIERIAFAKKSLDAAPIFFDDPRDLTISQLVAKSRQWIRRHGIGLVIVDYMQKISARFKDNRDRMTAISEGLRKLAKEEKIRVIGLSQMGRPDGKNMNARPTKFDPKESGSIENDVHLLISAYRPVDDHKMPTGADELIICKQRDGESSIEDVEYRGEVYTFVPRTETAQTQGDYR